MVFGQSFVVKDPLPGVDPSRRRVTVLGREPLSDDILVGNPIVNGATVQIIAHGGSRCR